MKLDGKEIAKEIIEPLKKRTEKLKDKKIVPHLLIIMAIDDPRTKSYVKQKLLRAKQIGAKVTIKKVSEKVSEDNLLNLIRKANKDKKIHGIIIQRPLPKQIHEDEIARAVAIQKDVDGFNPKSGFAAPVALAILKLIEVSLRQRINDQKSDEMFEFLKSKKITVIGKGTTAGRPVINLLRKLNLNPKVIDSKTKATEKEKILKTSDIIILAVGKKVLSVNQVKKGAFLIGIGMHAENEKLYGDYNEEEVKNKSSFYTPTPGGVGPVNVSMLMKNLVEACENLSK